MCVLNILLGSKISIHLKITCETSLSLSQALHPRVILEGLCLLVVECPVAKGVKEGDCPVRPKASWCIVTGSGSSFHVSSAWVILLSASGIISESIPYSCLLCQAKGDEIKCTICSSLSEEISLQCCCNTGIDTHVSKCSVFKWTCRTH